MFKGLRITCDEATTICDKSQYGEATFMEKMKLRLHFIKCPICPQYTKQNNLLTKLYNAKAKSDQKVKATLCMSDEEKEKLRKVLENVKE